jgi:hypothetical protein
MPELFGTANSIIKRCTLIGWLNFNLSAISVIVMFSFFPGSIVAGIKFLYAVAASKTGLAIALMFWHQAIYCSGSFRFCHLAHTLPLLALELRMWLNPRYWVTLLSQHILQTSPRIPLPSVPGTDFLLRRDGHTIFDFFKTLSFNGIPPPAIA